MKNIVIIGANSAIAEALAREYCRSAKKIYLLSRDTIKLRKVANDLRIRGNAEIFFSKVDVNKYEKHKSIIHKIFLKLSTVDLFIFASGSLAKQREIENSFEKIHHELSTNSIGIISLLSYIVPKLEVQKNNSVISVITSVAGDRGRKSNYIYGASKGLLSIYLQGLRGRLHKSHVHILDIKPGLIISPMTKSIKKNFLWRKPSEISSSIQKAIHTRKTVVYVPWFWKFIMIIIKIIPEKIFNKLNI